MDGKKHEGRILRGWRTGETLWKESVPTWARGANTGLEESICPLHRFLQAPDDSMPPGMLKAQVCIQQGPGSPRAASGGTVGVWGMEKGRGGRGISLLSVYFIH